MTNYNYDALNRVSQISQVNKSPITFFYDQGSNGIDHLTQMSDEAGIIRWTYDAHGRVAGKSFKTEALALVTRYTYSANRRLATITYPSGKAVQLGYNSNGQIAGMDSNGSPLLSGIHYQPFGPAQDWIFGNGVHTSRGFDLDGRLIGYDLGDRTRQLTYDAAGRIIDYLDSDLNYDQSFSYDPLGRLTDYSDLATQISYNYGANGNRIQQQDGTQSKNFNIEASSNRLLSVTDANLQTLKNYSYDASGHLISDGYNQFTYDGRGRLVQVANISLGVEQYRINGLGQRVAKIHGQASEQSKEDDHDGKRTETDQRHNHDEDAQAGTYFVYDETGHLMGEYNQHGTPIQETVWLGDLPRSRSWPESGITSSMPTTSTARGRLAIIPAKSSGAGIAILSVLRPKTKTMMTAKP